MEIAPLAERLRSVGYHELAIAQLLEVGDLSLIDAADLPRYLWLCKHDGSDLSMFVQLFLLGEGLPVQSASKLLSRGLISSLILCGVLSRRSGVVSSRVVVYPCLDRFIVTDYWVTQGQEKGQVYELGTDSYVLARLTPRTSGGRALDLCTGSGVHAVHSSRESSESQAVDINPRALEYTRLNAAINGVECSTHLGDLYEPLEEGEYDLITANPPYVPSPDPEVLVHRSAGETGDEVPERLVAGLPKRLAPGGLFSMVLEYPVLESESYLERLERWLGQGRGWGIAVVSFGEKAVGAYIKLHVGPSEDYEAKYRAYLESYRKQGIIAVDFAQVYILRCRADAPNWKVKKTSFWPKVSKSEHIQDWLAAQRKYRDPEWAPDPDAKPRLSSYYRTLWRDREHTAGFLEPVDQNWFPADPLSADEAELLFDFRGESRIADLRESWLQKGRDEASFLQALRGLGLQLAFEDGRV